MQHKEVTGTLPSDDHPAEGELTQKLESERGPGIEYNSRSHNAPYLR